MSAAHRFATTALIALVMAFVSGVEAWASCPVPSLIDQIARADVIASGVVTAVGFRENRFTFQPARIYKGALAPGPVTVLNGLQSEPGSLVIVSTSADYHAEAGTVHMLYLRREGSSLITNACTGSHLGAASGPEIAVLGGGRAVDSGGGPLAQLWDRIAAVPPIAYLGALVVLLLTLLWLRSRRGPPPLTPLSGAPA